MSEGVPACTVRNIERDFHEWHHGISQYGFWAISINEPAWLDAWHEARRQLARYLLDGYLRAPHVTLFACGLLDDRYFSGAELQAQKQRLEAMKLSPFKMYPGEPGSFTNCPFLGLKFSGQDLQSLRSELAAISIEDRDADYQPHLTLGLYNDAYRFEDIYRALEAIELPAIKPVEVVSLDFCVYQTARVQGAIEVVESVGLQ